MQTKNSSGPHRIGIFLFLTYSFGVETINTFIHSRSSLKNHTQFQTQMGTGQWAIKQTKTAQKPYQIRGTQQQFLENICAQNDLGSRIFGTFFVKFNDPSIKCVYSFVKLHKHVMTAYLNKLIRIDGNRFAFKFRNLKNQCKSE